MMIEFFAQRVVIGKANFSAVFGDPEYIPDVLKEAVARKLIDEGLAMFVPASYGGIATP